MDLPNRADFFQIGRRAIVTTPRTRINPKVIDIEGSDINLMVNVAALMGEEIGAKLAYLMQGTFADTARGEQLDRLAYDRYGLTRQSATPSRTAIKFTRGVGLAGTIAAGTRMQTSTGLQFSLDSEFAVPAGAFSAYGYATCTTSGLATNTGASTINIFVDAPFDPTITIDNYLEPATGGADAETDTAFRGRINGFFPTLRRGTLGAIQYGALQVPGVAVATAAELLNPTSGFPAAYVQLIVGDANGLASAPIVQAVRDELVNWRAAGIPVEVLGGIARNVPVTWNNLAVQLGFDQSTVISQVRAVTSAVAQYLAPGQTLYRSTLIAAAKTIPGLILGDSALASPLTDTVPLAQEVIRIQPGDVAFTYTS